MDWPPSDLVDLEKVYEQVSTGEPSQQSMYPIFSISHSDHDRSRRAGQLGENAGRRAKHILATVASS